MSLSLRILSFIVYRLSFGYPWVAKVTWTNQISFPSTSISTFINPVDNPLNERQLLLLSLKNIHMAYSLFHLDLVHSA
jgi:hypothetical protein